jgi:hypothetical protein
MAFVDAECPEDMFQKCRIVRGREAKDDVETSL